VVEDVAADAEATAHSVVDVAAIVKTAKSVLRANSKRR
jgi:hypothetical protein